MSLFYSFATAVFDCSGYSPLSFLQILVLNFAHKVGLSLVEYTRYNISINYYHSFQHWCQNVRFCAPPFSTTSFEVKDAPRSITSFIKSITCMGNYDTQVASKCTATVPLRLTERFLKHLKPLKIRKRRSSTRIVCRRSQDRPHRSRQPPIGDM